MSEDVNAPMMMRAHDERQSRALVSLDGLSVGDAFGQLLSVSSRGVRQVLESGSLPQSTWWHTDDTQMAMAIVEELAHVRRIAPDSLSRRFITRYQADPGRGYGKGARMQLEEMAAGTSWRQTSAAAFNGRGSKGNGSAMRSAPIGAYFADDLDVVVRESIQSSLVTHSHHEGIAGCVAVSVAAAQAWTARGIELSKARQMIWTAVLDKTMPGETWESIRKATAVPLEMSPENAARILGSGFLVTAPDTVPFALWCALRHLNDYREALIAALEGDGDCDTNCAIIGGIVAMFVGREGIPADWLRCREALDLCFD